MPYVYVDDIAVADIAFRAWGETLEDAFKASAEATVHAMVENHETIAPLCQRWIEVRDTGLDLLLLKFLQEFIGLDPGIGHPMKSCDGAKAHKNN